MQLTRPSARLRQAGKQSQFKSSTGKSLATLANGAGRQSGHSHHLRSITTFKKDSNRAHFLPEYMKNQTQPHSKRLSQKAKTMSTTPISGVGGGISPTQLTARGRS